MRAEHGRYAMRWRDLQPPRPHWFHAWTRDRATLAMIAVAVACVALAAWRCRP